MPNKKKPNPKKNPDKKQFIKKGFFLNLLFDFFLIFSKIKYNRGKIKKFMNVKLNGAKLSTLNEPIQNGKKNKFKNLFLLMLSIFS